MAKLEEKWDKLWKEFETTRKSEWLKSHEVGKFNAMVKEAPQFKAILKSLDSGEIDLLNACGNLHGMTMAEAPLLLKSWVSKMQILKKDALRKLTKASLDEMDKETKPHTYRALKVLITGIDEITSLAEYVEKTLVDAAANAGKTVSSQERVAKIQSLALTQVKKAVMKSLAQIQKVKADPTSETWGKLVADGGTRDLCMGLTSLVAAQQKGHFGAVPAALPLKNAAQPFNTGQPKSDLQANANPALVAQRLKEWSTLVKAVATAYQPHW